MAHHRMLCLIFLATAGLRPCYSDVSTVDNQVQENTPPSRQKEAEDNSRYKTLEANATLLKLLVDDKDGVTGSEVLDMLNSRDDNPSHVDLLAIPEDAEDARVEVPLPPNAQAEVLQAPENEVRKDSQKARSTRDESFGMAAGIMVTVTCTIVCVAYISLILWRRIYLKRNGLKHELLRNEENVAETRIEL